MYKSVGQDLQMIYGEDNYQKVSSSKEENISVLEGQFL